MKKVRITIMGSFVVDLMGRASHLPVTGETVKGSFFQIGPGGKGSNQAVAAQRAGAEVTMIAKIGTDSFSQIALECYRNEGIDTRLIFRDEEHSTGAALIMVDEKSSENKILVTLGANEYITDAEINHAKSAIENADIFLTQLETNVDAVEKAIDIAYNKGVKVVLNPAPIQSVSKELLKKVYILTPNEVEASILAGIEINTVEDASEAAKKLMSMGVENVIITMGSKGALVVTEDEKRLIPCPCIESPVLDTTGAGDAFSGGFATALAEGKDIFKAAEYATTVASLSVTRIGTSPAMPYKKEIQEIIIK